MDFNNIIIKNADQIKSIELSCKISAKSLIFAEKLVKEGITTREIDLEINSYIENLGAKSACMGYNGYPAYTCISVNNVICHGIPNGYKLKQGDILNIDVSTIYNGYYGDCSKTFVLGKISDEDEKLVKISEECMYEGIKSVIEGNTTGDIGYSTITHAKNNGLNTINNFCGHGVGLYFHEYPIVPFEGAKGLGDKLKEGMIITVEPMVCYGPTNYYIGNDGWTTFLKSNKNSAQFEHTVLVTKKGCEIFTIC